MTKTAGPSVKTQLLVIGAGPVGLTAALCAVRQGLSVEIIDQNWRGFGRGHATLLHPSSLVLLADAGLAERLLERGQGVDRLALYVAGARVATLKLPLPALAIRQTALEEVLLGALRTEGVAVKGAQQATGIQQSENRVYVPVTRREFDDDSSPAGGGEWHPVESWTVEAEFVIGADGYDSVVRRALGVDFIEFGRPQAFAIFEFKADEAAGREMKLAFPDELGSALTPLPEGRARWSFQVASELSTFADVWRLHSLLAERAPWYGSRPAAVDWGTVTDFERRLVRRFGKGRVWLAGDAAHVTYPFGGQSMNVGMQEAHELSERIADCVKGGKSPEALEQYDVGRQREWHKLLGSNGHVDVLPHAPKWLSSCAPSILPALPASGRDLDRLLGELGVTVG
jgi:2-polyprenyl-6-methoxyphenol hydroxylase-like FAD-dependent oxidoreductase